MRESREPIGLGPGLAGFVLVLVIAFALAAVLMLTGTLTNAKEINRRVKLVNAQVDPIDKNLAFVKLAKTTGQISGRIRVAAQNLSMEAGQIITVAGRINSKAASILTRANSINGKVKAINGSVNTINGSVLAINGTARSINGNVLAINGTAHAILGNADAINGNVQSIGGNVQSISGSVGSIGGHVNSIHALAGTIQGAVGPIGGGGTAINAEVRKINPKLSTINTVAQGIRGAGPVNGTDIGPGSFGVSGINNRASAVIRAVKPIKGDFDKIQSVVGLPNTDTILGHANSIDCSQVINVVGPSQACVGGVRGPGGASLLKAALLQNPTVLALLQSLGLGPILGKVLAFL